MRIVIYKLPAQEKVLYNLGQLLEKLSQTKKIGIFCDQNIIDIVDRTLWTFSSNAFLPHDIAVNDIKKNELQPVLISNNIKLLNREVICVFNNTDLFNVMSSILENNNENKIDNIIYMTQEQLDFEEIKNKTHTNIDIYEKNKHSWNKVNN